MKKQRWIVRGLNKQGKKQKLVLRADDAAAAVALAESRGVVANQPIEEFSEANDAIVKFIIAVVVVGAFIFIGRMAGEIAGVWATSK